MNIKHRIELHPFRVRICPQGRLHSKSNRPPSSLLLFGFLPSQGIDDLNIREAWFEELNGLLYEPSNLIWRAGGIGAQVGEVQAAGRTESGKGCYTNG